ncbi:MAG TPA: O-acetyl-ADP-ribose deacetylase [Candidatus Krumholzibacteria bacterium]|nr:O-acetyl-ADP-ribose deacetylase [Candidatus Krumholzibacteria bacterium]HPD72895.1 O-acetyl-ADP-ribose deacetylase [Candidatus Krumholzibacteria bacterium]HRY41694.1 O-acetyl-ADP-ribose deacetylase [Candidatus Krumholzibacteria bacterium]
MTRWHDRLTIVEGDITRQHVDAIVNAANEELRRGGGVCGAIHAAAGPALERECRQLGFCGTGEAVSTRGYDLPCKLVIHTVGPIWGVGAGEREDELLASCYRESIRLAADRGADTIAFPSISTGIYGFPIERAAGVALAAIRAGLQDNPEIREVRLVCWSKGDLAVYQAALGRALRDEDPPAAS